MLENFIMQVRRPKGVTSEREAFVSRAAQASAAACKNKNKMPPAIPIFQKKSDKRQVIYFTRPNNEFKTLNILVT